MKKFVVLYHSSVDAQKKMEEATPEQMAEGMKPWMAWAEKIGDALVEWGTPLFGGRKVTPKSASASDKGVSGYSILQAESMDKAVDLVKDHPHLSWADGCNIEVHESAPMPM